MHFRYANIYGEHSYPPLDGKNLWPMITNPDQYPIDAAHPDGLVLSKEVIISGQCVYFFRLFLFFFFFFFFLFFLFFVVCELLLLLLLLLLRTREFAFRLSVVVVVSANSVGNCIWAGIVIGFWHFLPLECPRNRPTHSDANPYRRLDTPTALHPNLCRFHHLNSVCFGF